ncbi:MAG: cytochrome oxidase [Deltaproteobacteria bacterium CG_4_10_14_0_2_um_filter_43_8]|nr:MAG: cytochrome oxidase [Deltaproteobacteria bacterium CG11_big_fil_rev_8_21_14_0_20_42_23]PJA18254.1 MAG: cytochrome oxidase [Deltaproteobacteria bacterium CG_4_10_14_0_2_um_filter_43_8]PJC64445.1 MAG: cytochrome oxidase [Deltaproteobacteria bacterium CG_4_9_14_0_2_um_filter_42_21]
MNIIVLLLFISFVLVLGAVLLFVYSGRNHDLDHSDELSLMPLDDELYQGKEENTHERNEDSL